MDFLENLGEDYEDGEALGDYGIEEANLILSDLFFSGLLKIRWDPSNQILILEHLGE